MGNCVKATELAIQTKMTEKVSAFRKRMEGEFLGTWSVEPLKGRGEAIEAKILKVLELERMDIVDEILSNVPRVLESFVKQEMMERKPDTLKCIWPQ